jgi:hypothetical protein
MTQPELAVDLCGVRPNPLILATGILGIEAEFLERVARAGYCLGAVLFISEMLTCWAGTAPSCQ